MLTCVVAGKGENVHISIIRIRVSRTNLRALGLLLPAYMLGRPGLTIGWPGIWLRWPRRACRAGLWQFENWKGKKFFRAVRCCSWSSRTDICQFVYWQMSSPCIKTICGWIMLPFFHRLPFVRVYFRHRLDRFIWILINSLTGLKSTFHAFCICIRFVFHLFFFLHRFIFKVGWQM